MKRAITFLSLTFLLACPALSHADDKDKPPTLLTQSTEKGPYSYEKIIEIPGVSQQELFERLKQWFVVNVKASSADIYYDDKDHSTISVSTALRLPDIKWSLTGQYVDFKLVLAFKEGRFRITGEGFVYHGLDAGNNFVFSKDFQNLDPIRRKLQTQVYTSFDDALAAMVKSMRAAGKGEKGKTDW